MRRLGIEAYQTMLLPQHTPEQIAQLNQMSPDELRNAGLRMKPELTRAFAISEPVFSTPQVRVHYAGELLEVMLSVRRFNIDLETVEGRKAWGRRRVRYFVYDPQRDEFAPSKFCGYLPVITHFDAACEPHEALASREMTIDLYTKIEATADKFDGNLAWKHLKRHLGMMVSSGDEHPELLERLSIWVQKRSDSVTIDPRGPVFLLSPQWFD
jgi:hypothetical protein